MSLNVKCCFLILVSTALLFAITRPPAPTITDASYTNGAIIVTGNTVSSAEEYHVVLLTDLSASLSNAYEIGSTLNPFEGAAVSFKSNTFPIVIPLGNQSVERYFVAVAASKKEANGVRVYSGWRVYTDVNGVPISLTTSQNNKKETTFYRARKISERNDSLVVIDFKFSLPTANASEYSFTLKRGTTPIVSFADLSNISDTVNNIASAIVHGVLHDNTLVIMRPSNGSYLYNIYTIIPDYGKNANDRLSGQIIKKTGEVDTVISNIGIYGDSSYQNMISTVYDLLRVGATVNNPIYPGTLQSINSADTLKARLLITAMLDLSVPHNSPAPNSNESAQGIFTNYIQCMDNIVRNWSTIRSGGIGLPRLRTIHSNILLTNRDSVIIDPVYIKNHGALTEYGLPTEMRKNYAYYDGYSRLFTEIKFTYVTIHLKSAVGIMLKISNNISLYVANDSDSINMFTNPILNGDMTRIIVPADDTIMVHRFRENGLWVKGRDIGVSSEQTYFTGVYPVRLPVQSFGAYPINVAMALPEVSTEKNDATGTLINGFGKNVFKMYTIYEKDGIQKNLEDKGDAQVMKSEKKLVALDSLYYKKLNVVAEFKAQGIQQEIARLEIDSKDRYRAEIKVKDAGAGKLEARILKVAPDGKKEVCGVIDKEIAAGELFLATMEEGTYTLNASVGSLYELPLIQKAKLGRLRDGIDEEYVLEISDGTRVFLDGGAASKKLLLPDRSGKYGEVNSRKIILPKNVYISDVLDKGRVFVLAEAGGTNNLTVTVRNKSDVTESKKETIQINAEWKNVIAEPVSNRNANNHTLTLPPVENACGVGKTNTNVYRIAVKDAAPEFTGEMIMWKSDHGNWLDFTERNGMEAKIKSLPDKLGVDHVLKAVLPGNINPDPEFKLWALGQKTINVTCYVGYDEAGIKHLTDADLSEILEELNKIYSQVEMSFEIKKIDAAKFTNIENLMKTRPYRNIDNEASYYNLVDLDNNTNGVEIYLITALYGNANGMNCNRGTAIAVYNSGGEKKSNLHIALTIAHEIGHACGLKDIYDTREGVTVPENTLPSNVTMPDDCNATVSYYDTYDMTTFSYYKILERLLMYGYSDPSIKKYDIPRGKVFGVKKESERVFKIEDIEVGLNDMYVNRGGTVYFRRPQHD